MNRDLWDGPLVRVKNRNNKGIGIRMTLTGASRLSLALKRLKQRDAILTPELEELLTALDYVLVGDPGSTKAHRKMEAAKGMDPASSGPMVLANHTFMPEAGEDRCIYQEPAGGLRWTCGRPAEEHVLEGEVQAPDPEAEGMW